MVSELIRISKYAGMREDLVQTGGGNSSVKLGPGCMLIKGMGVQMSDMRSGVGYSIVDQRVFQTFFDRYQGDPVTREQEEALQRAAYLAGPRPAIETFFHALTGRVTLHTHPLLVNVLTARTGGMETLKELFPDAVMMDYATPGLALGVELLAKMQVEGVPPGFSGIVFMKNHGLLISGENAGEVIARTEDVVERIAVYLHYDNRADRNVTRIYEWLSQNCDMDDLIVYRAKNADIQAAIDQFSQNMYRFCPDGVVFCGKAVLDLHVGGETVQIREHIARFGVPVVILYERQVYLVAQSMRKAKEIESVAGFCAEVCALNQGYDVDLLPDSEAEFLLNWEVEKYRKNL